MKKVIRFLIITTFIILLSFSIYNLNDKYNLNVVYDDLQWTINNKDCLNAVAFDFDDKGNIYVAYKNYIEKINEDNKVEVLFSNESLNIYDIAIYNNNNLIISSNNSIIKYDMQEGIFKDIVNNLPNKGINKEVKLGIQGDCVYATVGSNTNSGVVDSANGVVDVPSFQWILSGQRYGGEGTSGFSNFAQSVEENTVINEGKISNGTIIECNLTNNEVTTYATGIRNVKGYDFTSEGKIIAIVGGIEKEGSRGVNNDKDYIYKIKEKSWYGWPDFSGGDPINSPRFSVKNSENNFIIKNHPTEVVYGPMYQHNSLNSLEGLAIDKDGRCLNKDTVVFADNKEKALYAMSSFGVAKSIIKLSDESYIKSIKYYEGNMYILDSQVGCIYKLGNESNLSVFNLPKVIWVFVIVFIIAIILISTMKIQDKR